MASSTDAAHRHRVTTGALAACLVLLAACGGSGRPAAPTQGGPVARPAPAAPTGVSLLARAVGRSVAIYPSARAARPTRFLASPNQYGFRRVFLVKRVVPRRLEVYLPMRPNGSTGWITPREVSVVPDPYLLRVDLGRHRLTVLRRGRVIDRARIGVGTAVTPTPSGVYFLTELFRLTSPDGPFGPYGFGLSAYSNVLHQFAGADGQIGIHGTNDPGGIGMNVSHGCIRLANPEITKLARVLPLGTPVQILRS